jgi:hypothetical protein
VHIVTAQRAADRAELLAHLDRLDDAGHPPVCRTVPIPDRFVWTSDNPEHQDTAARLCRTCPAATACRDYIAAHPRERGVYGGSTDSQRRK